MRDVAVVCTVVSGILLTVASLSARADAPGVKAAEDGGANDARHVQIQRAFQENVVAHYDAVKDELAQVIRVEFDVSPQLVMPGEAVTLTIRARSATPPNPSFEVWQDCYDVSPSVHAFKLNWQPAEAAGVFAATWTWQPPACGNYLVHWQCDIGGDIPEFWRNISVVDRGWAVVILNSTSHITPRPELDLHRLHLPFSYWAESLLFSPRPTPEHFAGFSRNARQFGDDPGLLIFLAGEYVPEDKTVFYDEPVAVQRTVLDCYSDLWPMYGFPRPLNSLYTYGMGNEPVRTARELGLDLLGALCADQNWGDGPFKINHWGMPARPYFVSEEDFRKPGPGRPGAMVGVQQCERQTVLCRDYGCVYSFESGISYAFDQYSGITRPRVVDDMILSREMDFFECFLDAARQAPHPYLFSTGVEMNGVWPEMAAINRHFMELLVKRARTAPLAVTTASAAAGYMRRHFDAIPETTLYLADVFAGMTHGGKPPLCPDTMEIENASFRAIFRHGETLPYAQYDYTVPWDYPDWGNETIPRKPDGYVIPDTDDRFRVTPPIIDTRGFTTSVEMVEQDEATRVTITIDAELPRSNLALAVWNVPREFTSAPAAYRLSGAERFIPVRAPYTGNLCGVIVADVAAGASRIELAISSPTRRPGTTDYRLAPSVLAKIFERGGAATAYIFAEGAESAEVQYVPQNAAGLSLYPFDSDAPQTLAKSATLRIEPGRCQRITGTSTELILRAFPEAGPGRGQTDGR